MLNESTEGETILSYLKDIIKGTEWDNKVYIVGGYVRDQLMGVSSKDLDFVVNGDLNAGIDFSIWLGKRLGNYKHESNPVIFPRFGTSKLSLQNNIANLPVIDLEFVAPRQEQYDGKSRKPVVTGGDMEQEGLRRDLTLNSLMKNITTGEILDVSGKGLEDLKQGIIRTPLNPDVTFTDDPLRMLRAIRASVKYNFKFSPEVLRSIKANAHLIGNISNERIKDELEKILLSAKPSDGVRLLKITGLLQHIIPEFNNAVGMKQNKFHKQDVFKHSMDVLKNTQSNSIEARLMALFHDIGKVLTKTIDDDGSVHFYGHEKASEDMVKEIMTRLKYPNDLIKAVAVGVKNHMKLKHGGDDAAGISDKTLRKFKEEVGQNLEHILDVIHADNVSHSEHGAMPNQIDNVRRRLDYLESQITTATAKPPINGNDVITRLKLKRPDEVVGKALAAVKDAWLENPNITKDEALAIVDKFGIQDNINEMKKMIKKLI